MIRISDTYPNFQLFIVAVMLPDFFMSDKIGKYIVNESF